MDEQRDQVPEASVQCELRETGRVSLPREGIDMNCDQPGALVPVPEPPREGAGLGSIITQMPGQRLALRWGSLMFLTLGYFLIPK